MLWSWLPGDLLLLAGGPLLGAALLHRRHPLAAPVLFAASGAVLWATAMALALAILGGGGFLGAALMLVPALLLPAVSLAVTGTAGSLFRQATSTAPRATLARTAVQIVLFWGTFLLVLPLLIVRLEERLGLSPMHAPGQRAAGLLLLIAYSALGLLCGGLVAVAGRGTPLPLDSPRRLVVTGPYAYVRNPMAISGLGQGLAVALLLGSPLVLLYVLLGGALWQLLARPLEEDDLAWILHAHLLRTRQGLRGLRCGSVSDPQRGGHPASGRNRRRALPHRPWRALATMSMKDPG